MAAGARGIYRAVHLNPRTLIRYKASNNLNNCRHKQTERSGQGGGKPKEKTTNPPTHTTIPGFHFLNKLDLPLPNPQTGSRKETLRN